MIGRIVKGLSGVVAVALVVGLALVSTGYHRGILLRLIAPTLPLPDLGERVDEGDQFFTGDTFYPGELFAFLPGSSR
jgi:hypothetical protein